MSNHNIRAAGLKVTAPRTAILELFQNTVKSGSNSPNPAHLAPRHMGADEVHAVLLRQDIDVGVATIYRVLTQFEQAGILRRSPYETSRAIYELNEGDHHDHIVCLDCGHVVEFVDESIERKQIEVAQAHGFVLQDHTLSIYAHCQTVACAHKAARQKAGNKATA